MLELRHVTKRYSGIPVVHDVSFTARAGEITGYLSPNGSGKSTTLKMITGLIEPTDGDILYDGAPIGADLIAHKMRLGYVPEEPHLYPHQGFRATLFKVIKYGNAFRHVPQIIRRVAQSLDRSSSRAEPGSSPPPVRLEVATLQ